MNNANLENFNPKFINIKDYKTAKEYKNAFFIENIVNTSEYYELAILNAYFIHPFLSIKTIFEASKQLSNNNKSEITYRKVNDWNTKGLFEDKRTSNIQWRKYSIRTGVQLLLINDLKKFGYSNEQIKGIVQQIIDDRAGVLVKNRTFNYRYFDFYASTFYKRGVNFFIMIDDSCNAFYLTEKDLALNIAHGLKQFKPFLVLPFSKYLSVFAEYIFHSDNEKAITDELSLKEDLPNSKEQKIIKTIRDDAIKHIKIEKKSNSKSLLLRTTQIKNNTDITNEELENLVKQDKYIKTTIGKGTGQSYNISIEKTERLD